LTVTVLHSKTPNAFALPGGSVYVLSALIDKAADPDELGGVLAHELGHIAHRDGLRLMISNGGTAFLLSLLMGDVTDAGAIIFRSRTLVTSANTREAEANADAFAATFLHRLGRSSAPLGTFLVRLTGQQNLGALSLLQSHPLSQERLEALKRDDVAETGLPLVDSASCARSRRCALGSMKEVRPAADPPRSPVLVARGPGRAAVRPS
jgi:Zn-dependent protease with chaperone function